MIKLRVILTLFMKRDVILLILIIALGLPVIFSEAQSQTASDYDLVISARVNAPASLFYLSLADSDLHPITDNANKIQQDLTPDVSSDGDAIVFVRAFGPSGIGDIVMLDTVNNVVTNLTETPDIDERFPVVSPGGDYIAYVYDHREGRERRITVIDVTGKEILQLADTDVQYNSPQWSPDGTLLAFSSNTDGDSDIYYVDITTGNITQVSDLERQETNPAWSPDGGMLAFDYIGDLMLYDIESGNLVNITEDIDDPVTQASWSPDGDRLAFRSIVRGDEEIPAIYLLTMASGEFRILDETLRTFTPPRWSPDSRYLLLQDFSEAKSVLYLYHIETDELTELIEALSADWLLTTGD